MAVSRISGKNGAFTSPTGIGADFATWSLRANHQTDEDTSYADTTGSASNSGCGTVAYSIDAAGFLYKGSTGAPGLGYNSAAPIIGAVAGASITCTADTSCTFTGVGIGTSSMVSHSKKSGAIPVSYSFVIDGALAEAWVVA